jgi:restriction system protein
MNEVNVPETQKIPRQSYELPLLKSLTELGGEVVPGLELYQSVAQKMGFAGQDMEYDLVHARDKWIYTLQWVRHTLVKSGDMDGSRRGIWAITEQGRKRIGASVA